MQKIQHFRLNTKRLHHGSALSLIILLLCACGFTPVYSQKSENAQVAAELATIEIAPIRDLMGQEYLRKLEDVLDPAASGEVKKYILTAKLTKEVIPLDIQQDRTITRYKVVVISEYTLKEIGSGKLVTSGSVKGEAGYDKVASDYATYVSEADTVTRIIRELAQDTKIRLISALVK